MKKKLCLYVSILIVLNFIACSEENYNASDFVAGEVFTDSNIRVVLVDTMTVEISTMKFDSIITSGSERMLIGSYKDSVFGTVTCANYLGLLPTSYTINTEAAYDSIVLFLKYDQYYYNDTLKTNTIHVKRLLDNFNGGDGDNFYNTSQVNFSDVDLGAYTYQPRPLSSDSIQIKISDDLGEELFSHLQSKNITNNDEFTAEFKGLALQPDQEDNGAIIGFAKSSDSFYLRLYFTTQEVDDQVQNHIDFILNSSTTPSPFFNQIQAEEPIDYLKTLTDKEVNLSTAYSGNQSFIQSGIGIATRIQFPFIKTINNLNGQGTLLDAVLKIKPVKGSYSDYLPLSEQLAVYLVDTNNDVTTQLYLDNGSAVMATLNTDNEEFNDVYYTIPLGSYIENLLTTERNTDEALLLLPSDYSNSVDRFILNGNLATYKTILELTYAIYDEDN